MNMPRDRFLMTVRDASYQFEMVLDDLQRDAWPVPSDQRVARCTGAALQVTPSVFVRARLYCDPMSTDN